MIAVIIHWENASWVYKHEDAERKILKYYTHTLKGFGCSRLLIIDVDKMEPVVSDAEIDSTVFSTLEGAKMNLKGFSFVFVENTLKAQNLKDFKHPEGNTCYIVGSDYGELVLTEKDVTVKILTEIPLWAHVALAIVLNDRRQKE